LCTSKQQNVRERGQQAQSLSEHQRVNGRDSHVQGRFYALARKHPTRCEPESEKPYVPGNKQEEKFYAWHHDVRRCRCRLGGRPRGHHRSYQERRTDQSSISFHLHDSSRAPTAPGKLASEYGQSRRPGRGRAPKDLREPAEDHREAAHRPTGEWDVGKPPHDIPRAVTSP